MTDDTPAPRPSHPPLHRATSGLRRAAVMMLAAATASLALAQQADRAPPQPAVGMAQLQAGELGITLVYPTDEPARTVTRGPFVLQVALDAPPRPGLRRLVVMSHGTAGSPLADHALAATLARAGFVVAQPMHIGDNYLDARQAGPVAWQTRTAEITRVIDTLAAQPDWAPRLRLDRVGVHGMSAGGVTALTMAGAQWSLLGLIRHCATHTDDDRGFCFNGLVDETAQAQRRAQFVGARGVPDAYMAPDLKVAHGGRTPADGSAADFDPRPDPRVAAVTLAVPVAALVSADSLARIRIPVGVVSAGRDQMLMPAFHSGHVLRHCTACPLLADLPGAGHFDLLSPWPDEVARSVGARQVQGGYPEPGFDGRERDAAFDEISRFFTQHLQ